MIPFQQWLCQVLVWQIPFLGLQLFQKLLFCKVEVQWRDRNVAFLQLFDVAPIIEQMTSKLATFTSPTHFALGV